MKKILYLIPLFIFIFLISPSNVSAADYHYTFIESPITVEQKEEYLLYVYNSIEFQNALKDYPYYLITYQESRYKPIQNNPGIPYNNHIIVLMYQDKPTFRSSDSSIDLSELSSAQKLGYNISNSLSYVSPTSLTSFFLVKYTSYADNTYYEDLFLDYVIATNLEYIHSKDMNIYDAEGNLIKTISKGENIFSNLNIKPEIPEETIDPVIDSILNSEDTLYSLSKQLLGELPEEFTFLYSICQLFLGIVIILVVLSPVILLLRLFR
ncbi:MAG: hypothetical protein IJO43_02225 [Bacilli bacterium]|nr:hypothetical protein [Bacilli bacterium]